MFEEKRELRAGGGGWSAGGGGVGLRADYTRFAYRFVVSGAVLLSRWPIRSIPTLDHYLHLSP